ncbi:MAG TPA: DEAD/DEAH box helicase, partial [Pirellulaceae bacterium]|nr:DEAD/DEAH box helicase [Pirellulaceae bacterium]
MSLELFHPLVRRWFLSRFSAPTEPQVEGWPKIAAGENVLIAAPTGSGKTLSAFMVCIDRLVREWLAGVLEESVQVVYISPLKALSNDIQRNLQTPLAEIAALAEAEGLGKLPIRAMVRTGDTPTAERAAMTRKPPQILVTTPESLYLLLTSSKSRDMLRTVKTVIVDEIHALARDKRGSHLTLSLERLVELCPNPPVRIGLSATQKPMEEIAAFLVGLHEPKLPVPLPIAAKVRQHTLAFDAALVPVTPALRTSPCHIVNSGHIRNLDLALSIPPSELSAVCSHEQWGEIYEQLCEQVTSHHSTLVFVNTRRMCERVAHQLTERLGPDAVTSHHGSLSRELRLDAEQRLKSGELKAIVATASLEMGIDIGYIDLVCQIGSPRAIATFLQRVGRSGHSLRATPKGRLFPLTRDEHLECLALIRAVKRGELDRIEIPQQPLDILAQQIVATVACDEWDETALYDLVRRAWPYRDLTRAHFTDVLQLLTDGLGTAKRGSYLQRDQIHKQLRPRRGARLAAITSGGAIPEAALYRVVSEADGTVVGTVDEHFAVDSKPGDVFLLGNTSWRIQRVRGSDVVVHDAGGTAPTIPFWFGEAPGRTIELSREISALRGEVAARTRDDGNDHPEAIAWLKEHANADDWSASQASRYVATQKAALGLVPTCEQIVFERFFDESGGMQLVVHAPLGARINRAWGLALRKRFCRSFDFELQAAADDNGIVLSLSPQHSFPIDQLFKMLGPHNARELLEQAVIVVPMFQVRWRWNATRALAVLRQQGGKRVPPHLQRFRSDDLLATTFPETVGCLENHSGDVPIPDHPLVRQTMHDCLTEAMDIERWIGILTDCREGRVELVARDTREPSPFAHELLNSSPYTFLDGAGLEERRTRAVQTRRSLDIADFRDLAQLDPAAIAIVREQAWPLVRDKEELHDVLMNMVALVSAEAPQWERPFKELVRAKRATIVRRTGQPDLWIAAERWPMVRALYDDATCVPELQLPAALDRVIEKSDAWVELMRGRIGVSGPVTASELSALFGIAASHLSAAFEALEGQGLVLRGRFSSIGEHDEIEWCERRLLARIHKLTLDGLRKRIQPVEPADYWNYLTRHQRLEPAHRASGPVGVREVVAQLQGFELPAGAWESRLLAARVQDYDPQWLDQLFLMGELMWGRLQPPRRDEDAGPSMATLSRMMPLSLALREDLPWLLPPDRQSAEPLARGNASLVLELFARRGALFFSELKTQTALLATQLEEALRELAALGLVTSDAFAAVRSIVGGTKPHATRRRKPLTMFRGLAAPIGRWSRFPGEVATVERHDYLQHWCQQLLTRYGVVFRDLLARESAAPAWWELVSVFRRLEMKGEVRGGRFVRGVGGEQFATETAVQRLREVRDAGPSDDWCLISAADPL